MSLEDQEKFFREATFKQKSKISARQSSRGTIGGDRIAGQMPSLVRVAQDEIGEAGRDQIKILQGLGLYPKSC